MTFNDSFVFGKEQTGTVRLHLDELYQRDLAKRIESFAIGTMMHKITPTYSEREFTGHVSPQPDGTASIVSLRTDRNGERHSAFVEATNPVTGRDETYELFQDHTFWVRERNDIDEIQALGHTEMFHFMREYFENGAVEQLIDAKVSANSLIRAIRADMRRQPIVEQGSDHFIKTERFALETGSPAKFSPSEDDDGFILYHPTRTFELTNNHRNGRFNHTLAVTALTRLDAADVRQVLSFAVDYGKSFDVTDVTVTLANTSQDGLRPLELYQFGKKSSITTKVPEIFDDAFSQIEEAFTPI